MPVPYAAACPAPLRVVVADDSPLVRRGVVSLLADGRGLDIVGEAADAAGTLAAVERTRPDAVVLDLQMPDAPDGRPHTRHGLDALRRILTVRPAPTVIVLTHHAATPYRAACLAAGATAVVDKGHDIETLGTVLLRLAVRVSDTSDTTSGLV